MQTEYTDKHGTKWGRDSYTLADGEGDTFGPGHPNPPLSLRN